jgi:hypothetical protein
MSDKTIEEQRQLIQQELDHNACFINNRVKSTPIEFRCARNNMSRVGSIESAYDSLVSGAIELNIEADGKFTPTVTMKLERISPEQAAAIINIVKNNDVKGITGE